jgi:hypothetical protein
MDIYMLHLFHIIKLSERIIFVKRFEVFREAKI